MKANYSGYEKEKVSVLCTTCEEPFKERRDNSRLTKRLYRGKGPFKCPKCVRTTTSMRNKTLVGDRNPNWKGGVTDEVTKFYTGSEWKELRNKVFVRDNYTCQDCGKHGGYLEANHIKPRSRYPDLKLVASNIETLCKPCHDKKKWMVYE
jgi:hypothetical protein